MFGSAVQASNAYRRLAVESAALGADRHQLISLLFSAALAAIGQARTALARGDIGAKALASSRALRLVNEGLKAVVDRAVGEIGEQLYQLYDYCSRRLLQGHLRHEDGAYAEVAALIGEIDGAWRGIAPKGNATVRRAA